jgi:hypothetical protein
MAITPEQAAQRARPDEQKLKQLESIIDKTIITAQKTGTTATFDGRGIGDYATRTEIMDRYRTAGWHVEYHSDQREGDWLTFTPQQQHGQTTRAYWKN